MKEYNVDVLAYKLYYDYMKNSHQDTCLSYISFQLNCDNHKKYFRAAEAYLRKQKINKIRQKIWST